MSYDSGKTGAEVMAALAKAEALPSAPLGTAAELDVPASGDADAGEVVKGDDTRLTDAREWTVTTVTQQEAEDDQDVVRYAWTPERVWQAVRKWFASVKDAANGVVGLDANGRTLPILTQATGANTATLGNELSTNGSMSGSLTGWTTGTGWAYGSNSAVWTIGGSAAALSQEINVTGGARYLVKWTQQSSGVNNVSITPSIGGTAGVATAASSTSALTQTQVITAPISGSLTLAFTGTQYQGGTGTITITSVSVVQITPITPVIRWYDSSGSLRGEGVVGAGGILGVGTDAARNATTGNVTGVGMYAARSATTGNVTGVGASAAFNATTGNVTGVGVYAAYNATTGNVTGVGTNAARSATTGNVTGVGAEAARSATTGPVTGVGMYAAFNATTGNVTGVGAYAARSATTGSVTGVGVNAAFNATTGNVTGVGAEAARSATTGPVTGVGMYAAFNATTGPVTGVGVSAAYSVTTGNVTGVGAYAAYSATTGSIVAIGNTAGRYTNVGGALQTNTNSIYVGDDSRSAADGSTYENVIGTDGRGAGSYTTTIGAPNQKYALINGAIVSGTSTVASLPAASSVPVGSHYFATNGRKAGEASGSGTGVPVWSDGTNWKTYHDNTTVTA